MANVKQLYVFGFAHDNPQRLRKLATARTRFTITSLTTFYTQIAVGDCRDGVLFYSYHEVYILLSVYLSLLANSSTY